MRDKINKVNIFIWIFYIAIFLPALVSFRNCFFLNGIDIVAYDDCSVSERIVRFEDDFNESIWFKFLLVSINSLLHYSIIQESFIDKVIIGEEDWLFYNSWSDGNPMAELNGSNYFEQEEVESIAMNLDQMYNYFAKEGIEFYVFIAPNKSTIYYDKLPSSYSASVECPRTDQIIEYIENNTNVPIVYAHEELAEFREENSDLDIYSRTDTHWNNVGAFIGTKKLLYEIGLAEGMLEHYEITKSEEEAGRDLLNMLKLADVLSIDNDYEVTIENSNESNLEEQNILLIGDSFTGKMIPYIDQYTNGVELIPQNNYQKGDYKAFEPDIVIFEVVERYLPRMLKMYE